MVPVAVPKTDMEPGSIVTVADLAVREVPADLPPADAITPDNVSEYSGRMLRAPIREGAPLGASALVPLYDQFSRVIAKGNVGYTLQVDETNSISGMIAPVITSTSC
jgi:pilus assembly protein CpaB